MPPKVSILLSVHNGGETLDRALRSVFEQTQQDFEVICIDDGSTDQTATILRQWEDAFGLDRFRVLVNKHNHGLTHSLNRGLRRAQGQYVARIDADDEWHPAKLARQVAWLDAHDTVGVLGNSYVNIVGSKKKIVRCPLDHSTIRHSIWFRNPFGHSCVLIRSGLLRAVGGYDPQWRYAQDRDLWFRLLPLTQFHNLPDVLVRRRVEVAPRKQREQMAITVTILRHYLKRYRPAFPAWLGLIEPLAVGRAPEWLRQLKRSFS